MGRDVVVGDLDLVECLIGEYIGVELKNDYWKDSQGIQIVVDGQIGMVELSVE